MTSNKQLLDISSSTILRTIMILGILAFLFVIRDILIIIFLGMIIAAAINPAVNWMHGHRVSRLFGVISIYAAGIICFAGIIYLVVPPLAQEIQDLSKTLPELISKFSTFNYQSQYDSTVNNYPTLAENISLILSRVGEKLEIFSASFFSATVNLFGGIVSGVLILVISFYLAVQEQGIKKFMKSIVPVEHQPYAFHLWSRTELKMGRWLQGQLILALIIGILVFIGLSVLGIKYALVLAIIAGLFELIPYIGPVLAAVPAIILGATQSLVLGIWVLALYIIIQQMENHIIVPKVMQHAVSLNPLIIIIAIMIGAKLAGVIGIIIAVPIAAILAEIFYDFTAHEDWRMKDISTPQ